MSETPVAWKTFQSLRSIARWSPETSQQHAPWLVLGGTGKPIENRVADMLVQLQHGVAQRSVKALRRCIFGSSKQITYSLHALLPLPEFELKAVWIARAMRCL